MSHLGEVPTYYFSAIVIVLSVAFVIVIFLFFF